ncbi:type VI secretion system baseplate subunit TssK [Aquincola sp. MAHUQ-54]|uniref:Type VI secretion system baseplate subunit TssK n=1 Tax=Aquincola agrisoli TaxID=3119538 RepID=A0AAW9QFG8_9BURK
MTWQNKVMWTEGMFLQPQHFQQQDRFVSRLVDARVNAVTPHYWGFTGLAIDEAALLQGQLALTAATGVLPDGTPFAVPSHDAAPPALDIPADVRDEPVLLVAALARPGVAESDVEDSAPTMPPRFLASDVEVADSHAVSLRQVPVQIGRLNLRLMLARDANEGFAQLGVARIVEKRADGRLVLDAQYIPPTLHVAGNLLLEGFLREVLGMVRQRGEALAGRLAQPGRAGVGEIADFVFLQTLNRTEPLLAHLPQLPVLAPERLYATLLQLAGELSTFRERKRPVDYPPYRHDDLATCFRAVMGDLRQSLSMVLEQTAIPIELQQRQHGVRVAIIPDVDLQRRAQFVLAVNAQMPSEALRARFPSQVKIGPAEKIRDLVNLALPGVAVKPMPVAPRQIPYHGGFSYFELETRGSELWRELERSAGLAMHLSGDFPGIELQFWAIRP